MNMKMELKTVDGLCPVTTFLLLTPRARLILAAYVRIASAGAGIAQGHVLLSFSAQFSLLLVCFFSFLLVTSDLLYGGLGGFSAE